VPKQQQMHVVGPNSPVPVLVQPENAGSALRAAVQAIERSESSCEGGASKSRLRHSSLQDLSDADGELPANISMVPDNSPDVTIHTSQDEFFDDVELLVDDDEVAPGIFCDLELIEDVEVIEDVEIIETPSHTGRSLRKKH
jgi:hypothetical protein